MPKQVYRPYTNGRNDNYHNHFVDHDEQLDTRMDKLHSTHGRHRVSFQTQTRIPYRSHHDNFHQRRANSRDLRETLTDKKRGPSQHHEQRGQAFFDNNCYKVVIHQGDQYDKDFIISSLSNLIAPTPLMPIMYRIGRNNAMFYVDDKRIADKLRNCDRTICGLDNYPIPFRVHSSYPQTEVNDELKEKIKSVLAKRYLQSTNALDLSQFHRDPDLVDNYFCGLFKPAILMAVLEIVAEALPSLEALNLDNNNLSILERLHILEKKFPNLKTLHIGNNNIEKISQIDVLKELKLQELKLLGNPVCETYTSSREDYINDVRKRFPKLVKLDGEELPKPIVFELEDDVVVKLLPSQKIFSITPEALKIASQFMQQYFAIFDAETREPLLEAYHEHAQFSLTVFYPPAAFQRFNHLQPNNRNLLKIQESVRYRKMLKQGRLAVVSFISMLPKTEHCASSFTMDVDLVTPTMLLVMMTGCFKEREKSNEPMRYFDRVVTLVPQGNGFCISNEQLFITLASSSQEKKLTSLPTAAPAQSSAAAAPSATPIQLSDENRQQMVINLSKRTNMKLDWSLKCLQEVQWHFETAITAFNDFHSRGQIPSDAFL